MAPSTQPTQQTYTKDEKVLCFHHELLYEAKILDSKLSDSSDKKSQMLYRIHYKGWKNTWDDWVSGERIRKLTDENKELAQNLKKDLDAQRRPPPTTKMGTSRKRGGGSDLSSNRGSEERHSSVPATGRGQKRGRDYELDKPDQDREMMDITASHTDSQDPDTDSGSELSDSDIGSELRAIFEPPALSQPVLDSNASTTQGTSARQSHSDSPAVEAPPRRKFVLHRTKDGRFASKRDPATMDPPPAPRRKSFNAMNPKPPAPNPYAVTHPGLDRVKQRDPHNLALRYYYEGAEPDSKIMPIAGFPREVDDSDAGPSSGSSSSQREATDVVPAVVVPVATTCAATPLAPEEEPVSTVFAALSLAPVEEPISNISSDPQEESFNTRPEIRIPCPDHLKSILVDDWENVTKNLQLVSLPSSTPVNLILDTYFNEEKAKRRAGSPEADILEEVVAGMKEYFESSVGKILLYTFERNQYAEMRKLWENANGNQWEGKGPGDVYGAEHLARLFVSMPELIAQTDMDAQSIGRLREELSKMLLWLSRNSGKYYGTPYVAASQEYIDRARST